VDELASLVSEYGVRLFLFNDDEFADRSLRSRRWVKELGEEIRARELDIDFVVQLRVSDCIEEVLLPLKKAGLIGVFVGVESISQNVLNHFNKQVKKEDILQALALVERLGLKLEMGFIMFEPDMTIMDVRENLEWLCHCRHWVCADFCSFAIPFNGTPLREKLVQEGRLITKSWYDAGVYEFKDPRVGAMFDSVQPLRPRILEMNDLINEGKAAYRRALNHVKRMSGPDRAQCRDAIKTLQRLGRNMRTTEHTIMPEIFNNLLTAAETGDTGIIDERITVASNRELGEIVNVFRAQRASMERACAQVKDRLDSA
jgi:radical SAM superfamily enzyme YgiQ (UPF0313 family)